MKYTLNILPIIGEHIKGNHEMQRSGIQLMNLCIESDELNVFNQTIIRDLIEFKWDAFAQKWHYFGASMHFLYLTTFIVYVNAVYIANALGD